MAYLAFGAGPRACLGTKMAINESSRFLAGLLTRYRLEFCRETVSPLRLKSLDRALLHPADPIILRFEPLF